jgi:AcrR family transcriptional regulator
MRMAQGEARRLSKEDIMARVAPLFAEHGYSGVSMRDLAKACEITPAALYHHFDDKEQLYLETVAHAFDAGTRGMDEVLRGEDTLEAHIRRFVSWFAGVLSSDQVFRRMLHRELLDGDTARLRMLVRRVFAEPFRRVIELESRLVPRYDPYMLAVSLVSLVLGHFELAPIRQFLEGKERPTDSSGDVVDHVTDLLLNGLEWSAAQRS